MLLMENQARLMVSLRNKLLIGEAMDKVFSESLKYLLEKIRKLRMLNTNIQFDSANVQVILI